MNSKISHLFPKQFRLSSEETMDFHILLNAQIFIRFIYFGLNFKDYEQFTISTRIIPIQTQSAYLGKQSSFFFRQAPTSSSKATAKSAKPIGFKCTQFYAHITVTSDSLRSHLSNLLTLIHPSKQPTNHSSIHPTEHSSSH